MEIITVNTTSNKQVVDITQTIKEQLKKSDKAEGAILLFAKHTSCALTVADLDPGTDQDYLKAFEALIPDLNYNHPHDPSHVGDHILSAAIGPSLMIPFANKEITLGSWQSIVLLEFNGPKSRNIVITFI